MLACDGGSARNLCSGWCDVLRAGLVGDRGCLEPHVLTPSIVLFVCVCRWSGQIEVFEELGCSRPKTDYKGPLDGTYNDNLCIKVKGRAIAADIRKAEAVFAKVRN